MKKIYLFAVAMMAMFSAAPDAVADAVLDLPESVWLVYEGKKYRNGDIVPGNPTRGELNAEGILYGEIFYRVVINDTVVYDFNQVYENEYDNYVRRMFGYRWDGEQPVTGISVETTNLATVSTATLTIKSDRKVKDFSLELPRSLRGIVYEAGEQEVKFIPGKDYLSIWNAYGDFYCMLKNGELINLFTCGHIDIQDGDIIEVVTEIPDKMCHVEIKHTDGATDIINKSYYTIGGTDYYLSQDDQLSFDAKAGSEISWHWNSDIYQIPSEVIVNGYKVPTHWMGTYKVPVDRDNVLIEIKANKKETTGIDEISVDEAEAVYYNLQGVRVDNPGKGVYIVVRNGKATKVVR